MSRKKGKEKVAPAAHKPSLAIIGGGSSGLAAGFPLDPTHEVDVFEADKRLGGHAYTEPVDTEEGTVYVDTGAEFINQGYVNLIKLIQHLKIPLHAFTLVTRFFWEQQNGHQKSIVLPPIYRLKRPGRTGPENPDEHGPLNIEFRSLFNPRNVIIMVQMLRLLSKGRELVASEREDGPTLEEFLNGFFLLNSFKNNFIYPLLAAGWGVTVEEVKNFQAYYAMRYLVDGNDAQHYEWLEPEGGLSAYINALVAQCSNTHFHCNSPVTKLKEVHTEEGIRYAVQIDGEWVKDSKGKKKLYDHLVLTTNARDTAILLTTLHETRYSALIDSLSEVEYYPTEIAVHNDGAYIPNDGARLINIRFDGTEAQTTMTKHDGVFKSWVKPDEEPEETIHRVQWWHPNMNIKYANAREALKENQGINNLHFGGVMGYRQAGAASHEDAVTAGLDAAKAIWDKTQPGRSNPRLGLFFEEYQNRWDSSEQCESEEIPFAKGSLLLT